MQRVFVLPTEDTKCDMPLVGLPARTRCNMSCAGLPRRTERLFMFFARLQAALCLFSLLERGWSGFPRASMRQVVWSTFRRRRWNGGTMLVRATRQDTNHRRKLLGAALGKESKQMVLFTSRCASRRQVALCVSKICCIVCFTSRKAQITCIVYSSASKQATSSSK